MQDFFYGIEVPHDLGVLADLHQRHIADLVENLRTSGTDDVSIEAAVDQLIATYRTHLILAVKAIGGVHA